jgi:threonyl-tRNA synthetase
LRLLILHVSRFACTATQRGRSRLVEPLAERTQVFEDGMLILASSEAGDETAVEAIATAGAAEVANLAGRVGAVRALVHPFAHLFGEPSDLAVAVQLLDRFTQALLDRGLEASRSPFGWFFTWELSAKGHPLSRLARRFVAPATSPSPDATRPA